MANFEFELPEDLVLNILLRLPAICLVKFRCVCKAWHSILSDPKFMYKSLTFVDDKYDPHLQLLVKDYQYFHCRKKNDFCLIPFHDLSSRRCLPFNYEERDRQLLTVVGSYNGLVCLTDAIRVILVWNPLTGDVRVLPESPKYEWGDTFYEQEFYVMFEGGFCFDANSCDYKVIKIFEIPAADASPTHPNTICLYSFKRDIWTKLDFSSQLGPDIRIPVFKTPINSDEKSYHWVAELCRRCKDDKSFGTFVVVSFDVNLESFNITKLPYVIKFRPHEYPVAGMFMLKDYVAIVATPYETIPPTYEISVLLKTGVEESLMKLITIGPPAEVEKILSPWKNGSLFIQTRDGHLMVYDPFTENNVVVDLFIGMPSRSIDYINCRKFQLMTYREFHGQPTLNC